MKIKIKKRPEFCNSCGCSVFGLYEVREGTVRKDCMLCGHTVGFTEWS